MKRLYILAILCFPFIASSQLVVSSNITPTAMVQYLFGDTAIHVSNAIYTGFAGSKGIFVANNTNLGLTQGILLVTGPVEEAVGPNNSGSTGVDVGDTAIIGGVSGDNDADLDILCNAAQTQLYTNDAAVLEFDILTTAIKTIEIPYVFASEEYPEFVGSSFNDVFAFFLTGPGYNNTNIALVPGTATSVSVNTITDMSYPQYYVDNGDGITVTGGSIQFDGFTTPLSAVATLQPFQTYHIKMAIADVYDANYDSGVFIGTAAITTNLHNTTASLPVIVYPNPANGSFYLNYTYEKPATIELYDMVGKAVLNKAIRPNAGTVTIPTDGIANGIYNLKITAENGLFSIKKVIIN